jgi:hypothetical protein
VLPNADNECAHYENVEGEAERVSVRGKHIRREGLAVGFVGGSLKWLR